MIKEEVAEVGVIIGRFQSPYLHEGHQELIEFVINKHPRVFIFIGQSPLKGTISNTLDFQTRRAMVEEKYKDVEVHRIDDVGDNEVWSHNLDKMVSVMVGPSHKVVLYGSRDSFIRSYSGKHKTEALKPTKYISASEIRKNIGIKSKSSQEFREGSIHNAQSRYPTVYTTVDIVLFDRKGKKILLGKKPTDKLWRFPGGFSDVGDRTFEDDAIRELFEETNIIGQDPKYIGSTLVKDWRYEGEEDKIKTLLFEVTKFDATASRAGDDLSEIKWFKLSELTQELLVPNHRILLEMYIDKVLDKA